MHCMKRFLGSILAVAAALLAVSGCSKESLSTRVEFDAEWAAAYFLGTVGPGSVGNYQLALAQGRTDEDLTLISSGAVVCLQLSAPVADGINLPDGTYTGSAAGEAAFTFNYGEMQADNTVSGSYVGLRPDASKPVQYYPVGAGEASIAFGRDGGYEITVRVKAENRSFLFTYGGPIETFDCTGPEL